MFAFRLSGRGALFGAGVVLATIVLLLGQQRENRALRCRFGQEYRIFNSRQKLIDALAVVAVEGEKPIAFWSDAGGLYGRMLDRDGKGFGRALRIDSRCRGGLDAVADKATVYLACLRRSNPTGEARQPEVDRGQPSGFIALYILDENLEVQSNRKVGEAGALSKGVSLTVNRHGVRVVWHDGTLSGQSVWLAEINGGRLAPPRVISRNKGLAGAPSILRDSEENKIVWAETWVEGEDLEGEIMLSDGKSAPYSLVDVHYHAAVPQLVRLGGETILGFRDQRKPSEPPGIYVARLGDDNRIVGELVRIARADTEEPPSLSACFKGVVSATPRTYGHDRMVGVNWFDASLSKLGGEQQFCEDTREFSLATSLCIDSRALILIAERGSSTQEYTSIRSASFWCSL
jgi:hypothetical protein